MLLGELLIHFVIQVLQFINTSDSIVHYNFLLVPNSDMHRFKKKKKNHNV